MKSNNDKWKITAVFRKANMVHVPKCPFPLYRSNFSVKLMGNNKCLQNALD